MAKGRKPVYQSEEEKPIMLSLRIPRDLADKLKHYAARHRQSITEAVIEGITMRLETPADPRDIILSDDNTVIQEVQEMIQAAVQAAMVKMGSTVAPAPETPAELVLALSHDDNTVLQEKGSQPQGGRGVKRQRILTLLYEHQEGLSAEQIRAHLNTEENIGDTLQGMRKSSVVRTQGSGKHIRYFVA